MRRAITSVPPPAARPTMMRIGLPVCSSCAEAGMARAPARRSAAAERRRIKAIIETSLSVCSVFLLLGQQRSHDPLPRQRQIADAFSERAGKRIADRGAGRADRGFAEAERW